MITLKSIKNGRKGHSIIISDTGPGIPQHEHHNITKRFYRLDSSRTTPGSGLGLSLVSAIIQLHEMTLQFSDNDPGFKVEIVIPK